MQNNYNVLFIAGEASGDLLGTHLYKTLLSKEQGISCCGMGGHGMQEAGITTLVNCNDLAVVGVIEVLKHFKKIRQAYKIIKKTIQQQKPHLVILIDYPGFNLRVARLAKKAGCKVLYYVSPQIWAWRYKRIEHIKKYVDHMAVLFAFEEKIYQKANIPVTFVGHPIVDIARPTLDLQTARQQFRLTPNHPVIGLFPGSRKQEISRHLPIMISAIPLIKKMIPHAQFILPLANSLSKEDLKPWLTDDVMLIENNTYNAMSIMHAAIAVSGTVTLELALQKVPLVVIYKMSPLTFAIGKRLIKVPYIALCNLVAENRIAMEFIQHQVTPESIAKETSELVMNQHYRESIIKKFDDVINNLGQGGASERTAECVLHLLKK